MSSFVNLISDGCADFEKCGDVVVSPKDNIIGMYCHFCSDIFTNLLEFLHHLQWVHNDMIAFSKEHNVYSMEELMYLPDRSPTPPPANCSTSDSKVTADENLTMPKECSTALTESIISAFAAYDVDCGELEEFSKENHSAENTKTSQAEVPKCAMAFQDHQELDSPNHGKVLKLKQLEQPTKIKAKIAPGYTKTPVVFQKKQLPSFKFKRNGRTEEPGNRIKPIKKTQSLCNLKSYAIARSTRKREQSQRLGDIKRRIFRSLENDDIRMDSHVSMQLNHRTLQNYKLESLANNLHRQKIDPIDETRLKDEDITPKDTGINLTARKISSPIVINKIEYLPKIDITKWDKMVEQIGKPEVQTPAKEKPKQQRRSSLTVGSISPTVYKNRNRRTSYSDSNLQQSQMQSLKPHNKRTQLTMNTSVSIEAADAKRSKCEENNNGFQADPKSSKNVDNFLPKGNNVDLFHKQDADSGMSEGTIVDNPSVRDDLILLQLVGLPVLKDPTNEERKPVEYVEALRSKAVSFSKLLKKHEPVWNSKRFNGQFPANVRKELVTLTIETNMELKANLHAIELKRILNLITAWYIEQINQKFFRKVTLSQTIEYYLLLFGFLPKINRSLYYCEWCDEKCVNKSSYEKHRLIHLGIYVCPHCQRGYKKRGFLLNHVRTIHGKEY